MAQFRMPVGTGGGCKYVKLAEANANQTYGTQLTQLKATYDLLTDEDKLRTILMIGNYLLILHYTGNGYYSAPLTNANFGYIYSIDIINCTRFNTVNIKGSSAEIQNASNTSNANTLSLWILAS